GYCSTTIFYRILSEQVLREEERQGAKVQVIGIDHVYLAVSDLACSEKFYDGVMGILGFRKNSFSNQGDLHIQYYNRHFGLVLRPARSGTHHHDSLSPGLHHLCFRVEDSAVVD